MQRSISKTLVLLATAALTSCGGPSTSSSGDNVASSSTSKTTGTIVVPFWHTFGQVVRNSVEKQAEAFEKLILENTGVSVDIQIANNTGTSYDSLKEQVTKAFAVGGVPTITVAYPDHVADYLSQDRTYVYDVSSFVDDSSIGFGTQSYLGDSADYNADDFVPAFWNEGVSYQYEGRYSMPFLKSSETMLYNVDAAKKAIQIYRGDTTAPSNDEVKTYLSNISWTEFMKLCASAYENRAQVLDGMKEACIYDSDGNLFISKMFQEEIPYATVGSDGKGVIAFESGDARTKAEAMVTKLKKDHDAHLLETKGTLGNYGSDSFKKKEAIFCIGSTGGTGYSLPTAGEFSCAAVKVPTDAVEDNHSLYITQGPTLAILRNPSLSQEENDLRARYAWQFIKYLTNPEANTEISIYSNGYVPVRESAYSTTNFQRYLSDNDDALTDCARLMTGDINDSYILQKAFRGSSALRTQVGGIVTDVLMKGTSVSAAFDTAIQTAKNAM